ncbi:MOSC domain-containing protein [Paenibacillus abyssi]|uniref:Molybdenum cofactor biosysynthesis protein n=1 Tax=Paenibacillus abyssi TaxID=1340531 RepID=A0A917FYN1_9BACL|nr:MOSC N-terminal beta barrel domain-containing protein [Paenibacillus abyssi]GGG14363.1 molybdenum cofactor biosysynthesis protein [Paenibacillus abyssi]
MKQSRVVSLWRYPVKSMMGEEMNACDVTPKGLLGDRTYALLDISTGKLANAKNPLKWPRMFEYRAAYVDPASVATGQSPVRITFPDGSSGTSLESDIGERLSGSFNRPVKLTADLSQESQFEGYIPDIEGLQNRETVFTRTSPEGTFFDIGYIHILTTATINQLRALAPESRIEARRFRPNIVIDVPDGNGFVENDWIGKTLRFGNEVRLQIVQPTVRCVMTTLEQADLPQDPNVLRTAVKHNEGAVGVYAAVLQGGRIHRCDALVFE